MGSEPDMLARKPPFSGRVFEDRAMVLASTQAVWELLNDVAGWSRWNPAYPATAGKLGVGEKLDITISLPGLKPQRMLAEIWVSEPGRMLAYGATEFAGAIRATRYVEIEEIGKDCCMVATGEALTGIAAPLVARFAGAAISEGVRLASLGLQSAVNSVATIRSTAASDPYL